AGRHSIVKERLMAAVRGAARAWLKRIASRWKSLREPDCGGIVPPDDSRLPSDVPSMTVFSLERLGTRSWLGHGHLLPIALGAIVAAGAIALVAYLLWPTWGANGSSGPGRLPVSVGNTLFNVPVAAIRMKIQ